NFDELLNLIKKIDDILDGPSKFTLNKVVHLRGRRFEELVEKLNEEMYKQVFNEYKAGNVPDFEICHSNFEQYLTAESYILELSSKEYGEYHHRPNWEQLIKDIKDKKFIEDKDEIDFKHSVLFRKLASYD